MRPDERPPDGPEAREDNTVSRTEAANHEPRPAHLDGDAAPQRAFWLVVMRLTGVDYVSTSR